MCLLWSPVDFWLSVLLPLLPRLLLRQSASLSFVLPGYLQRTAGPLTVLFVFIELRRSQLFRSISLFYISSLSLQSSSSYPTSVVYIPIRVHTFTLLGSACFFPACPSSIPDRTFVPKIINGHVDSGAVLTVRFRQNDTQLSQGAKETASPW